ncbi:hypothetical protein A3A63_03000 [Candidatus Gottesmanbacteria bacterium RIFCSPLOWO2_01_FULL_46_9]|uniref:Yip1 domain-containing protein n=1 Tax=Candidatus Gottesmanbacteria bacterium RIFCSPLOWO2_01_FULL_46_9 TaxID=1798394 RepID=A0A1F6B0I1_9BACT|nr:MAG: hypothetical protein A3A63_03000 [Candidatus Gottesmanbacteria bacterium RIFCSPLOWO2_01_FULL_46_9]
MGNRLLVSGISFGRNCIGIVTRPYETYRRIVEHGSLLELAYIGVVLTMYFVVASIVKTSLLWPFLLTRQFIVLTSATALTFLFVVALFRIAGNLVGAKGTLRGLALGWGYSLLPTLAWFWMTSLLYIFLPPPRTTSSQGVAFSIVYLLVSATLLFWKVILSYLALRFSLRLDLGKIILVCAMVFPVLGFYTLLMYRLGIFRVPFI